MPATPPSRHPAAEDGDTPNTAAGQILRPMLANPARDSTRLPDGYRFAQLDERRQASRADRAILNAIASAADAATAIEAALIEAVDAARKAGFSWADIGTNLGTTGEDARARYGSAVD